MAPQYKLVYFNGTGLGEPIRYMLHYGNLPFDDDRFEMAQLADKKPNSPFGKFPVLEVDGKKVHQSAAICRYLAKQTGIAGKSDWDQLQADITVDTFTDFRLNLTAWFREQDETKKAALLEEIKNTHIPFYFEKFDKQVQENGGYFVNGQLTWADVYIAAIFDLLLNVFKTPYLDSYKNLSALKAKVENLPGIKEYRAKRPQTAF